MWTIPMKNLTDVYYVPKILIWDVDNPHEKFAWSHTYGAWQDIMGTAAQQETLTYPRVIELHLVPSRLS